MYQSFHHDYSVRNAVRYTMGNTQTMEETKPATLKCSASLLLLPRGQKQRGQKAVGLGEGEASTLEVSCFHNSEASGCPVKDLANMKGSRIIKGQTQELLPQPGLADAV